MNKYYFLKVFLLLCLLIGITGVTSVPVDPPEEKHWHGKNIHKLKDDQEELPSEDKSTQHLHGKTFHKLEKPQQ